MGLFSFSAGSGKKIREKESIKERRWEKDEKEAQVFALSFFLIRWAPSRWEMTLCERESLKKEKLYSDDDVIWELDFLTTKPRSSLVVVADV